ncbi:hypothetical protein [Haloarcula sp. Atlit-7R]|uniref:DUF7287 family protein n=1 Tax=Haloarcula sp. Atlit-7R TaxID=2282125 RepID=UPI000EF15EC0|nr:hypothetical protein [Haloarcula sp. Atlit-7R]RLM89109.1 hypothetical protein D3D01_19735 [Haloarcula sp. Atlit-7R]
MTTGTDAVEDFATDNRGQTLQDYVFGVSVFLLTVAAVVGGGLPTMLATFDDGTRGDTDAQAKRIADQIVTNTSLGPGNRLNVTLVEAVAGSDVDTLQNRYRLPTTSTVNVTIRKPSGSGTVVTNNGVTLTAGRDATGRTFGKAVRLITIGDGSCDPACQLIVRVW